MSLIKNINNKITGIKKIIKITQAMELISASKINKIKFKINLIKKNIKKINNIIINILMNNKKHKHFFFLNHNNIKKIIFIFITTDKGLCGNLNLNSFNLIKSKIKKFKKKKYNIEIINIGKKGLFFLKKINVKIIMHFDNFNKNILNIITKIVNKLYFLYKKKKIKFLYIIYTKFINTLKQIADIKKILPILKKKKKKKYIYNYIYEPNFKYFINLLLITYIKYIIYKLYIINEISEQYSRMINMHNANNNANDLRKKLYLNYNKYRQFNVTKELSEIISSTLIIN